MQTLIASYSHLIASFVILSPPARTRMVLSCGPTVVIWLQEKHDGHDDDADFVR
jgi:hypothetical protein